ncbi:MAG: N-acetylmuramoyl-L-alanine amidase [Clostridia bacterium]|nr:N-acetylmuramoyl-L-alanine amidase [Clostridia bacterium]
MKPITKGAGSLVLLLSFLTSLLLSGCGSLTGAVRNAAGTAAITRYYTYGTYFQLEGTARLSDGDLSPKDVRSAALVLRAGPEEADEVFRRKIPFSVSREKNTLAFRSASKLEEGLCFDTLPKGEYASLLELTAKDGEVQRWTLRDGTGSEKKDPETPIEYYTLPYRHGRRKVTAAFRTFGERETLVFEVRRSRLPKDVYDVVVDPGHGGKDPGARSGSLNESDVVLSIGKQLASALERAGYKVLLTRDGTEDPNINMAYTEYDPDGRVNRTCASRAKLCLSLHLNSNKNAGQNGVQIYRARQSTDAFAKCIANELVNGTALDYSTMGGRTARGVYTKTFSNRDIAEARSKARKKGYTFYDVTTATDYFFMIREYGCLATGAYVDGRNPDYGTNEYRTANQGVASCLCELGFLTNEHDRQVLLNGQRAVARALTNGVDRYIASLYEAPANGAPSTDLLAKESI